jgi:hypothetical protein
VGSVAGLGASHARPLRVPSESGSVLWRDCSMWDGAGEHQDRQERPVVHGDPGAAGVSTARPGPAKEVTVNAQIGMAVPATAPLTIRAQRGPLPANA